jgi:hypothetical protein
VHHEVLQTEELNKNIVLAQRMDFFVINGLQCKVVDIIIIVIIIITMVLQPFVGPWPIFKFLDPTQSR